MRAKLFFRSAFFLCALIMVSGLFIGTSIMFWFDGTKDDVAMIFIIPAIIFGMLLPACSTRS